MRQKRHAQPRTPLPEQRPTEHVIFMLRRHWIVVVIQLARLALFVIGPIAVYFIVKLLYGFSLPHTTPLYALVVVILGIYYLFIWDFFFSDFIDYFLDIWVLTDQRVVSIEQLGLFNRLVSELNIMNVEDVTSEVRGFFPTVLNYGEVHIQTAGSQKRFVFEQVPEPQKVAQVIMEVHNQVLYHWQRHPAMGDNHHSGAQGASLHPLDENK